MSMSWEAVKAAQDATPTITAKELVDALLERAERLKGTGQAAEAAESLWAASLMHKALLYRNTPFPHNQIHDKPGYSF